MNEVKGGVLRPPEPPIEMLQAIPYMVWMASTVMTAPLEMALRRKFGSRYFSPVIVFVSLFMAEVFGLVGLVVNYYAPSHSLFGMSSVVMAFRVLVVAHFIRLLPAFRDLSKERLSVTDGPGWAFFGAIPHSDSWLMTRAVFEPVAALIVVSVLYTLHVLSGFATFYLTVSAWALFIKVGTMWWQTFQWQRDIADSLPRAEAVEEMDTHRPRTASTEVDAVVE